MCPGLSFAIFTCASFLSSWSTSGISSDRAWESPLLHACSRSVISCVSFMLFRLALESRITGKEASVWRHLISNALFIFEKPSREADKSNELGPEPLPLRTFRSLLWIEYLLARVPQ